MSLEIREIQTFRRNNRKRRKQRGRKKDEKKNKSNLNTFESFNRKTFVTFHLINWFFSLALVFVFFFWLVFVNVVVVVLGNDVENHLTDTTIQAFVIFVLFIFNFYLNFNYLLPFRKSIFRVSVFLFLSCISFFSFHFILDNQFHIVSLCQVLFIEFVTHVWSHEL